MEETREIPVTTEPERGGLLRRVREHPGTTLAVGSGIAALLGAEWAIGALVGIGAAMLLTRKSGPEMRQLLRRKWHSLTTG